jgi:hypothetical protein
MIPKKICASVCQGRRSLFCNSYQGQGQRRSKGCLRGDVSQTEAEQAIKMFNGFSLKPRFSRQPARMASARILGMTATDMGRTNTTIVLARAVEANPLAAINYSCQQSITVCW